MLRGSVQTLNNPQAKACFNKFLPSINRLREICLYKKLDSADCPDSPLFLIPWLGGLEKTGGKPKNFPELRSLISQILGEQNKRISESAVLPLKPATPENLFPTSSVKTTDLGTYRRLYDRFINSLLKIPAPLQENWSNWLDHFDSAWAEIAVNVPAGNNLLESSVSLYDSSKSRAAIPEVEDVLLIQGDFQGIQNFIFTEGSETNKKSSKLIRGRSFYVSLISELAALRLSEALGLPPISPIMNAAGKFLIAAPYSEENVHKVKSVQKEFDEWFLSNALGTASLVTSCTKVSKQNVLGTRFDQVMKKVFEKTEEAKLRTFDLVNRKSPILETSFAAGVSPYDIRLPANSELCKDEIKIGELLVKSDTLLISKNKSKHLKALSLPIFGYFVYFGSRKEIEDEDYRMALRVWDISLPESMNEPLFNGLARRFFSSYASRFTYEGEENDKRYSSAKKEGEKLGDIKTFGHLACDNTSTDGEGIVALASLKGDVDNLGMIFREGILNTFNESTCAAVMCLSRQINNFFAVFLPVLFAKKYSNTYTVFSGGDDFFLLGPWHDIFELAGEIKTKFGEYCRNKNIHFSAGIVVMKPNVPIRTIARMTEESLQKAKEGGKNRVTAYGITVTWERWGKLEEAEQNLNFMRKNYDISIAYLYRLLDIISLYEKKDTDPLANVWRSRLYYMTVRFVTDRNRNEQTVRNDFIPFIVTSLDTFGKAFTIPLFNSLYTTRKTRN